MLNLTNLAVGFLELTAELLRYLTSVLLGNEARS